VRLRPFAYSESPRRFVQRDFAARFQVLQPL